MTNSQNPKTFPWNVELSAPIVHQVRGLLGVDLMDPVEVAALARNAELFVNVIYIVCRDQADERGMTSTQFGESLSPVDLKPAAEALRDAVIAFRPVWRKKRTRQFLMTGG